MEEEGEALLDQDKEWGGEEREGGGEEGEGGREGESEEEQVLDREDDSRSDEHLEPARIHIEIEPEGNVRVLSQAVRDSLGDQANVEENVPLPRRLSVRGGWTLLSPSLDREATEEWVQQQRGKGK